MASTRRLAAGLVSLLAVTGCERWGSQSYFERVVGLPLTPDGRVVDCFAETGLDHAAFRQVQLPQGILDRLRPRPLDVLGGHPARSDDAGDEGDVRVFWRLGPLSGEGRRAYELALLGAESAIRDSACGADVERMRRATAQALPGPRTFHSYRFSPVDGEVADEGLEFRILDLDAGILYELINFS